MHPFEIIYINVLFVAKYISLENQLIGQRSSYPLGGNPGEHR